MASTSKPTAVHFALVFFVMTTLILALVTYLTAKEYYASAAKAREEADKAAQNTTALNNALTDVSTLKTALGYNFESIGAGTAGESSVMGALTKDLRDNGREQIAPNPSNPTVAATLQSLRTALDASATQVKTLQASVKDAEDRLAQETSMHRNRAQQLQTSQEGSETQLQKLVTDRDELLAQKDSEINKWRQSYQSEQVEKERLNDELARVRKDLQTKIGEYENTVQFLRQRLNALENMSFDKADGEIVRVNNTTRTVWINLGSNDHLREQIGFSVYVRNNSGVGRGKGDIKAKIQVSKITGPNLAEANIISEDVSRPIQDGDPIYTPLWEKGAVEHFSFIGVMDLNGDGVSDRQQLRDILANAGAKIEVELDDTGVRIPADGKVTVKSKFLVVGEAEDPSKFPGFDKKQAEIKLALQERSAIEEEALRAGIRIVRLQDFLNYIGYEPPARSFAPGEDRVFNLKSGSRSAGVDEVLGPNRASNGNVSGRFKADDGRSLNSSSGR